MDLEQYERGRSIDGLSVSLSGVVCWLGGTGKKKIGRDGVREERETVAAVPQSWR